MEQANPPVVQNMETSHIPSAPIHKLPIEILSEIFMLCTRTNCGTSVMNGRTPAVIAAVCHYWQSIMLSLPTAWSIIEPTVSRSILEPKCSMELMATFRYIKTCLERSNPYPVHVRLPDLLIMDSAVLEKYKKEGVGLVLSIASRISCLWTTNWDPYGMFQMCFPILTRLSLGRSNCEISTSLFSRSNFPSLCYLDSGYCTWVDPSTTDRPLISPLKHLVIGCTEEAAWIQVVQECSPTLTGLQVYLFRIHSPRVIIHFPVLEYLQIEAKDRKSWPIQAITPALRTYDERLGSESLPIGYATVSDVKYLRLNALRDLHLYPSLETLQLTANSTALATLAEQLETFEDLCPKLCYIEFLTDYGGIEETKCIGIAERALLAARPHITFLWGRYRQMTPLPGSQNVDMCGHAI
ncbi:hypothetical protein M408DRAFT_252958 [Serendipita vermifera MAFF 305830]|uniref:F-box domain-containing protein n=1 Tax=Serendipita vermifera MAFF 305830 TaxID=933852 RepID=A0A0C3AU43_SERVB|nr:hypothetical protein M408DRAFT_252958 [Serendipita vermifera MAFF 305830]